MSSLKPTFKPKFDHIGIVVKNLEKAVEFFTTLFELESPPDFVTWDEGRYTMITTNGPDSPKIEPLEPKKGWLLELLNSRGEMTVAEICFRVDNIEKFYNRVKELGLTPADDYGVPLVDKKYFLINDQEDVIVKCFYFNLPNSGVSFEILEYSPGEQFS